MQFRFSFSFNRLKRQRLHAATAGLTLAVWLLVSAAEICPPLHAWMHGGSIPDDDDCAVVAIALGHVDSGTVEVPPLQPVFVHEIVLRPEVSVFQSVSVPLPNDRAPPFLSAVS